MCALREEQPLVRIAKAVVISSRRGAGEPASPRSENADCLLARLATLAPAGVDVERLEGASPEDLRSSELVGLLAGGWVVPGAELLQPSRLGDLATALNHLRLWRQLAELPQPAGGPEPALLVLEDDASVPADLCWGELERSLALAAALASAGGSAEGAAEAWAVVYLFEFDPFRNRGAKKRLPESWDSLPLSCTDELLAKRHGLGLVGYLLTRRAAVALLSEALPLRSKAIDQVLTAIIRAKAAVKEGTVANGRFFVANPPLVHHDYSLGSVRRQRNSAAKAAAAGGVGGATHCAGGVEAAAHAGEDCDSAWRAVAKADGEAKADKWCGEIRGCTAARGREVDAFGTAPSVVTLLHPLHVVQHEGKAPVPTGR